MVFVKHKHLDWLSIEGTYEFKQLATEIVLSNYFSKSKEIARIIRKTVLDSNACNDIL